MKGKILRITDKDNVIVALTDLKKDEQVVWNGEVFILQNDIPAKHKFYTQDFKAGDEIIMYGVLVGKVQTDVLKGSQVTTHNLQHAAGDYAYRNFNYTWQAPDAYRFSKRTFNGYIRSNGDAGTANYWLF